MTGVPRPSARGFRSPSRVARRLLLTPRAARTIKNWPHFMLNYALGLVPDIAYTFRNGARLRIDRGVDHVPIIEIFLREDYGRVPDRAVVLDLGANIGAFSVYATTVARDIRVFAYEPLAEFFRRLQDNVRMNRVAPQVSCFNIAVAASNAARTLVVEGEGILFPTLGSVHSGGSTKTIIVPCMSLTEILEVNALGRVDLVKMDCEGAEYEILYSTPPGSFDRLREIRMEYHNQAASRHNVDSLVDFLRDHRYDIVHRRAAGPTTGTLWARRRD